MKAAVLSLRRQASRNIVRPTAGFANDWKSALSERCIRNCNTQLPRTSSSNSGDPQTMVRRTDDTLRCSFCGKSQNEVKKLIAGPTVYICNECIDICNEIITDDQQAESVATRPPLPKPGEIKSFPRRICHRPGRNQEASGRRRLSALQAHRAGAPACRRRNSKIKHSV